MQEQTAQQPAEQIHLSHGCGCVEWSCCSVFLLVMVTGATVISRFIRKAVSSLFKGNFILNHLPKRLHPHALPNGETPGPDGLAGISGRDPNFSRVNFQEFASTLYQRFYACCKDGDFSPITPFVAQEILTNNPAFGREFVQDVGVCSMALHCSTSDPRDAMLKQKGMDVIRANIDARHLIKTPEGHVTHRSVKERWYFSRRSGVLSPGPERFWSLGCPSCGAAVDTAEDSRCSRCGALIMPGDRQWQLWAVHGFREIKETYGGLQGRPADIPTLPSHLQGNLEAMKGRFAGTHQLADWEVFWQRFSHHAAETYFLLICDAWNRCRLEEIRHLISDALYDYLCFLMAEVSEHGVAISWDEINIQRIELIKIETDRFFESITVRIFALQKHRMAMTTHAQVAVKRDDAYSHYWTFTRKAGVEKDEASYDPHTCPKCGAQADRVGRQAICGYCGTKINHGGYSWVVTAMTSPECWS